MKYLVNLKTIITKNMMKVPKKCLRNKNSRKSTSLEAKEGYLHCSIFSWTPSTLSSAKWSKLLLYVYLYPSCIPRMLLKFCINEKNSRICFSSIAVFGSAVLLVHTVKLSVSCLLMESYHQSCTFPTKAAKGTIFELFNVSDSLFFLFFLLVRHLQELVFAVTCVSFAYLTPLLASTESALCRKDCSSC